MRYFLDPIRRSLNHVINANYGYSEVSMAGISGGALTTTVYAALDTRISTSIENTGTMPFTLKDPSKANQYDLEQNDSDGYLYNNQLVLNDFYGTASGTGFLDLYVMASYGLGRRHVQVLDRFDSCCFGQAQVRPPADTWGQRVRAYEANVRNSLYQMGFGSFRIEIDDTITFHGFSDNARVTDLSGEIHGANRILAASDNNNAFARGMSGHLYYLNASTWSDTGFAMAGTPAVVSGAIAGHVHDVFFRDPFNRLQHVYYNGGIWTADASFSGTTVSTDPTAMAWGAGRVDVVALGGDSKIYHWFYNGSWSASVGPVSDTALAVGPVALASWGPNRLDMFFRGRDRQLYHVYCSGVAPYTVELVGGTIKNYPTATASLAHGGTLWAFVVGMNDGIWLVYQEGGGAWSWLDVSAASGASATRAVGSPSARTDSGLPKLFSRIDDTALGLYYYASGWHFSNEGSPASSVFVSGSPTITSNSGIYTQGNFYGAYLHDGQSTWISKGRELSAQRQCEELGPPGGPHRVPRGGASTSPQAVPPCQQRAFDQAVRGDCGGEDQQ
jgi:hypothetical protein